MDTHDWDERYAGGEHLWSGEPNEALSAEAAGLTPGRALDVGCGEGADAVWLASRGWTVDAVDVSEVAIERGRVAAASAGVDVAWHVTGLAELPSRAIGDGYDLVSAMFPALPKEGGHNLAALLGAVRPGGTLLVVHHAHIDRDEALAHGCDPLDFLSPDDVAAAIAADPAWEPATREERRKSVVAGAGAHHHADDVLRVRRR